MRTTGSALESPSCPSAQVASFLDRTHTALHRHTALTALAALRQVAARTLPATTPPARQQPPPPTARPEPNIDPADLRIPLGDSPVPTHPNQPRPPDLGHIRLSIGEHHRLHTLALTKTAGQLTTTAEAFHLTWSKRRRNHQATARWHHRQRHLRLTLDPT